MDNGLEVWRGLEDQNFRQACGWWGRWTGEHHVQCGLGTQAPPGSGAHASGRPVYRATPPPLCQGFRLLLASPRACYRLLQEQLKEGHGEALLFQGVKSKLAAPGLSPGTLPLPIRGLPSPDGITQASGIFCPAAGHQALCGALGVPREQGGGGPCPRDSQSGASEFRKQQHRGFEGCLGGVPGRLPGGGRKVRPEYES